MIKVKASFTGIIILIIFIIVFIVISLEAPITNTNEIIVTIPYNSSSAQIIEEFNQKGFLQPAWFYKTYIKILYKTKHSYIQAGSYKIPEEVSNNELLENIFNRKYFYGKKITFPEGLNIYEFASILHKEINVDSTKFIQRVLSKDFIKKRGINAPTLEGYLMPNTYYFNEDQPIDQIINTLVESQKKIISDNSKEKKSFLNDYQALILASIIQAETPLAEEMALVSSVYHNRLQRSMLLQADPTILYAIYPRKIIYASDLILDNKYNTYKYKGLPPTPINNPSSIAIHAAFNPEKTNYFYFVKANDTSSSHLFSSSYAQHRKNVKNYRNN